MKADDLLKKIQLALSIKKGFIPITGYIYFDKNTIKATNMEYYVEAVCDEMFPFSGCVLSEQLKKFLESVNGDTELRFEKAGNTLVIQYGKKNKFYIPTVPLADFPESPKIKFTEDSLISSIQLTESFKEVLLRAMKFTSKDAFNFNGIFIENNNIYSTNRAVLFNEKIKDLSEDQIPQVFLIYDFVKFCLQTFENFERLEIYKNGYKLVSSKSVFYCANFSCPIMPVFENIFDKNSNQFIDMGIIPEIKESINRISAFNDSVNVEIKDNLLIFSSDNIREEIEFICDKNISFKINPKFLKNCLNFCDFLNICGNGERINAVVGVSKDCRVLIAVIE